jgi:hypothetical protein
MTFAQVADLYIAAVPLGSAPGAAGAMAAGMPTALVGLDE